MNTQQAQRLQTLFHEALDLPPAERLAHLRARCQSEPELLQQLESLVAAYAHVSTVLGPFEPRLGDGQQDPPGDGAPVPAHPRYRIMREIGRGGMGIVYLATDLQLDRPVALKFMPARLSSDPGARMRLVAEARAAGMLDHPNVCTIYDVGETADGRLFIAMAYVPAESLRARIARGPVAPADAVEIASQVAAGLAAAHSRGLVHRDIKPANLLFATPDLVKIVDFGIAERVDPEMTRVGTIAGTMAYMSPEQARGEPVDARTDIWSLGVVLYEMLTGTRPFPGDTAVSVLHGILHQTPPPLTAAGEEAGALQRVIDRTLAKDPEERYASAEALLSDLRAAGVAGRTPARSALPGYLTSFVGRDQELRAVRAAVLTARLVTLTGPPGTGKTRLAVQLAAALRSDFPDGIVFVPLAAVDDPAQLPSSIAQALGVRRTGSVPVQEAVKDHLSDKRLLMVLDNFEQILPAAALLLDLVTACRRVTVLVTSRASLRLSGEREFVVPPLACPDPAASAANEIAACEAVALFVTRAATQIDLPTDEENMLAVAEICRRLDGLPLAIELAAARVKVLPPRALLKRLQNRLDLLKGGARDLPSRHQTLRQAIAWSYDLLAGREKKLLQRLSVCSGGFTLDAAERIAAAPLDVDALEGLTSFVDNNLLQRMAGSDGEPRFTMLETIREFALECLVGAGEEAGAREAHRQYFRAYAEEAAAGFGGPEQARRFEDIEQEHDNLRGAFESAVASEDSDTAERIAAALWRFWLVRGHLSEGRERIRRVVLTGAATASPRRLELLRAAGTLAHNQGDYDAARTCYEQTVAAARLLGDRAATADALADLGWVAWRQGDYRRARALSSESLELHRAENDPRGIAHALNNLGWIAHHEGDYRAAEAFHRQTLEMREAAGDSRAIGFTLANLAWALLEQDQAATARDLVERGRVLLGAVGERQLFAFAGVILAACEAALGQPARALEILQQSTTTFRKIGDRYGIGAALARSARAAADLGDHDTAVRFASESLSVRREIGDRWGVADALAVQARLASLAERWHDAARLWQEAYEQWERLGDRASAAVCRSRLAALPARVESGADDTA